MNKCWLKPLANVSTLGQILHSFIKPHIISYFLCLYVSCRDFQLCLVECSPNSLCHGKRCTEDDQASQCSQGCRKQCWKIVLTKSCFYDTEITEERSLENSWENSQLKKTCLKQFFLVN